MKVEMRTCGLIFRAITIAAVVLAIVNQVESQCRVTRLG